MNAPVPAGLRPVSRDTFWAAVMAEKRNIHPRSERLATDWEIVGTRARWGWMSTGYASPHGEPTIYALPASPLVSG